MRLSTFKGTKKSFLKGILYGVLLLSALPAEGILHVQGLYDLDRDGLQESLVLNAGGFSAVWVEISGSSVADTLWSYTLPDQGHFNDAEVIDIDGDGQFELVATGDPHYRANNLDWLYVFQGSESGFSDEPLSLGIQALDFSTVRPSNLTLIPGDSPKLGVSFGSPVRQAMAFDIDLSNNEISLTNVQMVSAPIISNGYGVLYVGGFTSGGGRYLALLSPEGNKLKSAIFDVSQNFDLVRSEILLVDDARLLMGAGVQGFRSMRSSDAGLIIPYGTDDIFLLEMTGEDISFSKTNLSGKGAFPASIEDIDFAVVDVVNTRIAAEVYPTKPEITDYLKIEEEKKKIPPPVHPIDETTSALQSESIPESENATSLPGVKDVFYRRYNKINQRRSKIDSLTPTLGDFLASVKKDESETNPDSEKVTVPDVNEEMESVDWADEAGFLKVDLGEYVLDEPEKDSTASPIPDTDSGVSNFTESVRKSIAPKTVDEDTSEAAVIDDGIDLYYVLVMTPAGDIQERYIFDGEAPFGIAVNQVPAMGDPTHYQHGISANLANLRRGDTFDFAYSLRDAQLDSITTLTMVHDVQTNVVFMSISPQRDSLSQSYQPEAFDPKLFEFPYYFFEGFPTSLTMDFTDKLIRFSFAGEADSVFKGIYLSATTPSDPSQSLAVFLDEGTLQSVRGEVVVRANGSKKITTEFDLVGFVEPSVMFSRLIQESFPDDLKIRLLQGTTLAEPLFGPHGKLPRITRKNRLPEAQSDQGTPEIPVEPKQSIIPDEQDAVTEETTDLESAAPETNVTEEGPSTISVPTVEDEQQEPEPDPADSLRLEEVKEPAPSSDADDLDKPEPEEKLSGTPSDSKVLENAPESSENVENSPESKPSKPEPDNAIDTTKSLDVNDDAGDKH